MSIQFKRGLKSSWNSKGSSIILKEGQIGLEYDGTSIGATKAPPG